jgi:transcriptional regulator with PAS, ATPase and Fis domain
VADTDATVLVRGESGTGKELVARGLHARSARRDHPFVKVNCAALPTELLESELFGFERGAFTGAVQSKPGQIELAAGGVLFLDEVSEMSLSAQAKFLRVLQEREFQRLGGTRPLKANVRVVAATNRDLLKAVERGAFRQDLFYRLQVFDIRIPPLRERRGDILLLCEVFLEEIGRSFGRPPAGLTREAKDVLLAHDWPGNVRELENTVLRLIVLPDVAEELRAMGAQEVAAPATLVQLSLKDARALVVEQFERHYLAAKLREHAGNVSRAAEAIGVSRQFLHRLLERYGISREPGWS